MTPLHSELETLIRNGQLAQVRERLNKLDLSSVARNDLAAVAGIARRAGLPETALRLLTPVVRPVHPLRQPATVSELAVYAVSLARIGAFQEAMGLFDSLRKEATPEVMLFEAFTQIHQWNYAEAVPCLRKYLATPLAEYEAVIGKMNLAACYQYLGTHSKEKDDLLSEILASCSQHSWVRMERNALELSAQSAISRQDWEAAETLLGKIWSLSASEDLFVEKWRAVLALKKERAVVEPLHRLREKALAAHEHEILRECDFYEAVEGRNEEMALRVYFGSPAPSYRKRLRALTKGWLTLRDSYVWSRGRAERILDVVSGKESGALKRAKPSPALLLTLQFLSSDFYRSFPLGSLFAHLYPGEVFNVDSSPSRVRRVVERLREWFVEQEIPLQIDLKGGQFRLVFTGDYGLLVPRNVLEVDDENLSGDQIAQLRSKFGARGFSTRDAAAALELSVDSARKLLQAAVKKKKLKCVGRGRATQFRF
ncbi:MAG: hypothetical protein KF799_02745 [Bdellovibrionales bacterium]|nr:hypothetical protein [Bdellovibrionales bacterium]